MNRPRIRRDKTRPVPYLVRDLKVALRSQPVAKKEPNVLRSFFLSIRNRWFSAWRSVGAHLMNVGR